MAEYVGIAFLITWIEGGFSAGINTHVNNGFGSFNADLNSLYNPLGKSTLFHDLDINEWGQGDASSYLGAGCILLAVISVVLILIRYKKTINIIKNNMGMVIAIIAMMFISLMFACIPNVTINGHLLFSVPLPSLVESFVENFRCNGRTMWIISYFIMILSPIIIYKYLNKNIAIVILIIGVMLQVVDLKDYLAYKYGNAVGHYRNYTEFESDTFNNSFGKDETIKNVVVYTETFNKLKDDDAMTDAYVWAIDNGKTSNYIYLARDDEERYVKRLQDAMENPREDYLYILSNQDEEICKQYGLYYTAYGRYIFARTAPINN